MIDKTAHKREDYKHWLIIPTRWMDNDVYGHVNNVLYYAFFDTVINEYLIEAGGLDIHAGETIGLAVETQCQFLQSIAFPEKIDAGLRVTKLGNSSVRYEIGLFKQGESEPAASGYFVHVFVNRHSRRPETIPDGIRSALAKLIHP
jgi:acyl-CoA thioester hydrolase